jgi:hypothetical protein
MATVNYMRDGEMQEADAETVESAALEDGDVILDEDKVLGEVVIGPYGQRAYRPLNGEDMGIDLRSLFALLAHARYTRLIP